MKLTVDCILTSQLSALPHDSALAYLLSKANREWLDLPLEALLCNQHGLKPELDYPLAVIAVGADGLNAGDAYWLRADPVHLTMQRDSFSLSDPVPVPMRGEHAEHLVASLNQHFGQDGLTFVIGRSGAWYLRLNQAPQIKTDLPSVAVGKGIYQFMPQGATSAKWRAFLNEAQMLLHDHPVNMVRESAGEVAVNSIWLSGGGVMPLRAGLHRDIHNDVDLIIADHPFYRGLAQWSGFPSQAIAVNPAAILQNAASYRHVRLQWPSEQSLSEMGFHVLLNALKANKIKALTLNLGCYEKTLTATMTRLDTFKFWQKLKPVMHFLA